LARGIATRGVFVAAGVTFAGVGLVARLGFGLGWAGFGASVGGLTAAFTADWRGSRVCVGLAAGVAVFVAFVGCDAFTACMPAARRGAAVVVGAEGLGRAAAFMEVADFAAFGAFAAALVAGAFAPARVVVRVSWWVWAVAAGVPVLTLLGGVFALRWVLAVAVFAAFREVGASGLAAGEVLGRAAARGEWAGVGAFEVRAGIAVSAAFRDLRRGGVAAVVAGVAWEAGCAA
jgi:hypothetical protein